MDRKELELYIHIPFCVKKCDYCDFLSFAADNATQQQYVEALEKELQYYGEKYADRVITTIFIGGGTPSWLDAELMEQLMDTVYQSFAVEPDAEITIECNPGTITEQKFEVYKKAGINRLSIGLQSAHNEELKLLGRIHTYEQFLKTYDMARKHGFSNINIDLMSSLPGQTPETFADSLKKVLKLKPEHISAYSLIIEEGTPFYKKYESDAKRQEEGEQTEFLPNEEEEYRTTKLTQQILKEAGFHWYEVSNFAKPGYECRHNIGYWKRADYLGVGLGAASLIDNVRYANTRDLCHYLQECEKFNNQIKRKNNKADSRKHNCNSEMNLEIGTGQQNISREEFHIYASVEPVSKPEQMEEFMFLGLRMRDGITRAEFEQIFQTTIDAVYGDALRRLQQEGLLVQQEGCIFLTDKGMDLNNYVIEQFML